MRKVILMLLLLSPLVSLAQDSNLSEGYEWMTKNCKDLDCVSGNIAIIDGQIASLMAKRLAYVKRGAEIKNHNVTFSKEPGGYSSSSEATTNEAKQMGTSPAAVGDVFKSIEQQSDTYEKKFLKPTPQQLQQQQQQQQQSQQLPPGQPHPGQPQPQQPVPQAQPQPQQIQQQQEVQPQQEAQPEQGEQGQEQQEQQ